MKLTTQQKNIELSIDSFEFPYDKNGLVEDNNWLNVKVICEDEILKEDGISPCLLTWELEELVQSLYDYIAGKVENYTSAFRESNLEIRLQPYKEEVACYISFRFPNHNDPFVFVKTLSREELLEVANDLKIQSDKFPKR